MAARPKNKSLHHYGEKCEVSFQWVIDYVCCCETLQKGWSACFVEVGRWEILPVGIEVQHVGREGTCSGRQGSWPAQNNLLEILSVSTRDYQDRSINTTISGINSVIMPEQKSVTAVQWLKGSIDLIIHHFDTFSTTMSWHNKCLNPDPRPRSKSIQKRVISSAHHLNNYIGNDKIATWHKWLGQYKERLLHRNPAQKVNLTMSVMTFSKQTK